MEILKIAIELVFYMERMVNIMNKLRVWWIPQVGAISEAFYVPVQSVEEGKKVVDMLAAYDAFQLQNRIKPDYSNAGGLQVYNPEIADYEDWYLETEDDLAKYDDYLNELENDGKNTNDENYEFYNKEYEKVYGHSAFDNNDNFN